MLCFGVCVGMRTLLPLLSLFLLIIGTQCELNSVSEYHIVFASNDVDRPGVEKSIHSIEKYTSKKINYHYIGFHPLENVEGVDFVDLNVVGEKYLLSQFFNPILRSEEKPQLKKSNLPNYARYVLPDIFPNISKILYLDPDTEVMCDIIPLFNQHLMRNDYPVAALPREGVRGLLDEGKEIARRKNVNVSFNIGVMMIDLKRWRELGMTEQIREICRENQLTLSIYEFPEPPLTLTVGNDFEHLPEKWDFMDRTCLDQIYPGEICCLFQPHISHDQIKDQERNGGNPLSWVVKQLKYYL